MANVAWDSEFASDAEAQVIRPLFTIKDLDDQEKILAWSNNAYDVERHRAARYRQQAARHLSLYGGRWYDAPNTNGRSQFAEGSLAGVGIPGNQVSKLVINHLHGLTNQRVSRITRTKPDVTVQPANAEYGDRVSARLVKFWLDYLFYVNKFDALLAECSRAAYIMGESYIGVFWDASRGEMVKDWRDEVDLARQEKRPPRLPVIGPDGEPVLGSDGETLYIERPVRTGDVCYKVLTPMNTLIEACGSFDAANYFFYEDFQSVDELKALYPEKAHLIREDSSDDEIWQAQMGATQGPQAGKALVRYFYHKSTDFLASGRFILSTRSAVLENKALPPGQEGLPVVRLTDIDTPNEQRGKSFYTQGKSLNASINDLSSMIRRNAMLLSHPRWLIPRGSVVKREALGNDITQIEYAGPVAPKIEAPPPMSSEINVIRQNLRDDLYAVLGVSDTEVGKVPPNVRSALALQAVNEQADQRANSAITKYNALIEGVAEKSVNLAAAYYEKGDSRLIPVVGRDNQYLLQEFDPKHLTRAYDIRVTSGGGMPTGAARTEALLELRKQDPDGQLIKPAKFMELLEWGDVGEFYDAATVAVKSAEAENEAMLNQEPIQDPAPFEDLVTHWTTHLREFQNRGFKVSTPAEVQRTMIKHTLATEFLMLLAARKNPAFALELVKLPQFPVFYELSVPDRMLLDRARTGNPLSLVEIDMLYTAGVPPQTPMTGPPPVGGMGAPQTPAEPTNRNDPMYNQLKEPPAGAL